MSDPPDGLIETRKWYKNVMAVIALVAAIAGGVYGFIQFLETPFFSPKEVRTNIEIVVDRSKAMEALFDGVSKWDAAVIAVRRTLDVEVATRDNLALRQFGGPCLGDNSELVVDFGQNNERKVENAMRGVRLGGETTIAAALVEATGDFNDLDRFGPAVNKSIIVITGGVDPCHDQPGEVVRDRLLDVVHGEDAIRISFRLIGAGLTPEEQADLTELAAETGGRVSFAWNTDALNRAVRNAFEGERAGGNDQTGIVRHRYLGCFQDRGARDLDGYSSSDDAMTNDKCIETCGTKDFRYAGTQYSRECYCGDAFGRYGRVHSKECSDKCAGEPGEFCGGYWRNSVFEIESGPREQAQAPSEVCPASLATGTETITCNCPQEAIKGSVWGSGTYTSDSSICGAALHAGAVPESGGEVTVRDAPGCRTYEGTEKNGVTSSSYGRWGRSFFFPAVGDGACPGATTNPG